MGTSKKLFWTYFAHIGVRATVLLGVGALLGFTINRLRDDGFDLGGYEPPASCGAGEEAVSEGGRPIDTMTPEQVAALCGAPGVVVVDVRDQQRFAAGHVVHALHLPCTASASDAKSATDLLASNHTLVVYGDASDNARRVAEKLRKRSARPGLRIVIMAGGFEAWNAAGLACASGTCDNCPEDKP